MRSLNLKILISTLSLAATTALTFTSLSAHAKLKKGDDFPSDVVPALNGGGPIDVSKYKGKVVIVDFWASWCEPCKIELPALNALSKKLKGQDVVIVGVNLDEKKSDAQSFLKAHPVQLAIGYDGDKKVLAQKGDIETMPTSFILDKKGKIAFRHQAFRAGDEKKIEAEVMGLLKEK